MINILGSGLLVYSMYNKNLFDLIHSLAHYIREAAKKIFFSGPATKRGKGVKAGPLKKLFFAASLIQ